MDKLIAMSRAGVLFLRCPACHTAVCSGIVATVREASDKFAENRSFCLVCRQWFRWAEAQAEVHEDAT